MRCIYCGSHAHSEEYCPKTWGGTAARNSLRCSYCGGRDHNHAGCPKLGRAVQEGGVRLLDRTRNGRDFR